MILTIWYLSMGYSTESHCDSIRKTSGKLFLRFVCFNQWNEIAVPFFLHVG